MSALLKPIERTPCIAKCLSDGTKDKDGKQSPDCAHAQTDGETRHCAIYVDPAWKWELGQCNFATHIKREAKKEAFINPLKLAKMRARGLH